MTYADTHASHDTRPYDPFSLISGEPPSGRETGQGGGQEHGMKQREDFHSGKLGVVDLAAPSRRPERRRVNIVLFSSLVAYKVFNRLKYVPLTFGSVIGFIYSLFAYK